MRKYHKCLEGSFTKIVITEADTIMDTIKEQSLNHYVMSGVSKKEGALTFIW